MTKTKWMRSRIISENIFSLFGGHVDHNFDLVLNRVFVRTSLPIKCQRIISKYQKKCEILFSFWVIHLLLFSVFPVMPKASLKKYLKTWNLFLFVGHNFAPICCASKNLFTSPRIISKSIWIYSYKCWMRFLQSLTFCQINQSREYF